MSSDLTLISWIAAFAIGIGFLVAGKSNSVVIYYDWKDMRLSLWAALLPLISIWIFFSLPFESEELNVLWKWLIAPVTGLIGIHCLRLNFQSSIQHNRSLFVGFIIGAFKILFGWLSIFAILNQHVKAEQDRDKHRSSATNVAVGLFFIWLLSSMVNGEEVYKKRGWKLP